MRQFSEMCLFIFALNGSAASNLPALLCSPAFMPTQFLKLKWIRKTAEKTSFKKLLL